MNDILVGFIKIWDQMFLYILQGSPDFKMLDVNSTSVELLITAYKQRNVD